MLTLPPLPNVPQATSSYQISSVPEVPFYSQFKDITPALWRGRSCGIASLAMLIEYYKPASTSADILLGQALDFNGYIPNIGWTYKSLIEVAALYGLDGDSYDFGTKSNEYAFSKFKTYLAEGPVMVSIHYKFDPKSTIPHLVVINGIEDDVVYYNDPAAPEGGSKISLDKFLKGWKKRFIVIRPTPLQQL